MLQDEHLQPRENGPEQVGDGEPEVNAHIACEPLCQGRLEAVEGGNGEDDGPEDGQHDEVEGADGVDDERCGLEEQLQQPAQDARDNAAHAPVATLAIHLAHGLLLLGGYVQGLELPLVLFVREVEVLLNLASLNLGLHLVMLPLVAVHVESLSLIERVCGLYHG